MIINSLKKLDSLPSPALGLLKAFHDAEVDPTPVNEAGEAQLPPAEEVLNKVFLNTTSKEVILPPYGKWPARVVNVGDYYGCDGRLFYRVKQKAGTTSYYPTAFDRTIFNFSFTKESFPVGSVFELDRLFYFRLIANNVAAVWSVIMEIGVKIVASAPEISITLDGVTLEGSRSVTVDSLDLSQVIEGMVVTGAGIASVSHVHSLDLGGREIKLTRPALASGTVALTFRATPGPNIERVKWLTPLVDVSLTLTELKSINPLGVWIKNWGSQTELDPLGGVIVMPGRNEAGIEAYSKIYEQTALVPPGSLPEVGEFLLRVRVGQFDVQDDVRDPKGYAAYVVRALSDPEDVNEDAAGVS